MRCKCNPSINIISQDQYLELEYREKIRKIAVESLNDFDKYEENYITYEILRTALTWNFDELYDIWLNVFKNHSLYPIFVKLKNMDWDERHQYINNINKE